MSSARQSAGKIAVVGDRELVLGYRLLGVDDTFDAAQEEPQKTVQNLFASDQYSLIILGDSIMRSLPAPTRAKLESSVVPLVISMPPIEGEEKEEESLATLARRVLGVDLKVNG